MGQIRTSVILPTYEEAHNLPVLVPRICEVLDGAGIGHEVIVVDDDSPDGTADAARALSTEFPVRVIVRKGERGLASAVLEGFGASSAEVCAVMDADGSHPSEALPALIGAVLDGGADVAVGSRHVPGGGAEGWPLRRKVISRVAAFMAVGLTSMSDPTTGFMAIRRTLLDGLELDPVGFKIVLEVVVRAAPIRLAEVPITFTDRQLGHSKMSRAETLRYLRHLGRLYGVKVRQSLMPLTSLWSRPR